MRSPRDRRRWQTPFGRYLARRGVPWIVRTAQADGHPVTPCAVYQWLAGRTAPRLHIAHSLIRTSDGALTLDDICLHQRQVSSRHLGPAKGSTCRST